MVLEMTTVLKVPSMGLRGFRWSQQFERGGKQSARAAGVTAAGSIPATEEDLCVRLEPLDSRDCQAREHGRRPRETSGVYSVLQISNNERSRRTHRHHPGAVPSTGTVHITPISTIRVAGVVPLPGGWLGRVVRTSPILMTSFLSTGALLRLHVKLNRFVRVIERSGSADLHQIRCVRRQFQMQRVW